MAAARGQRGWSRHTSGARRTGVGRRTERLREAHGRAGDGQELEALGRALLPGVGAVAMEAERLPAAGTRAQVAAAAVPPSQAPAAPS